MSLYQYFYSGFPNWFKMYLSSPAAAPLLRDQYAQLGSGFFSMDLEGLVALSATSRAAQADRVGLESTPGWFLLKKDWAIVAAADRSHVHNSQDHLLRYCHRSSCGAAAWACCSSINFDNTCCSRYSFIYYIYNRSLKTRAAHTSFKQLPSRQNAPVPQPPLRAVWFQ